MIEIYTDGSCKNNPGIGTYGFVVYINNIFFHSFFHTVDYITTNNIMELLSIHFALYFLHKCNFHNEECYLFTDSQYAYNGITLWSHNWIQNNWKTSEQKSVLNQSIWKDLLAVFGHFTNIKLNWIRAHTNNIDKHSVRNSYVDALIQ